MGLTSALTMAGRALEVMTSGIQVAGNNIANANNPDFIREKLEVAQSFPVRQGALIYGSGVTATGIRQQIDRFLEERLHVANSDWSGADARNSIYKQLEAALQELGDSDLSSGLNTFLAQINNLINQPELATSRTAAVQQGVQFAQMVSDLRARIDGLRSDFGVRLDDLVTEANHLVDQIADLNHQIVAAESSGLLHSDAGTLRSQRYAALNRLSEIIPIRTIEREGGQVDVFVGITELVIPGVTRHLETTPRIDRGAVVQDVRVEGTKISITGTQGEINGTTFGRDNVIGDFIDKLDQFTSNFIFEFNKIHSAGQGLHGYTDVTGAYRVGDATAPLNAAGLAFTPTHGSFQVQVVNQATNVAQTSEINVDLDGIGTDTTLNDLVTQLGGVANLTASITSDGRLRLTAANGYEIRFAGDSSGVLAALGINTFFTGSSSSDIGVNEAVVDDPSLLAAGQGGGPADGRNAIALAAVASQPLSALGGQNLTEFYQTTVSNLAQASASEDAVAQGFQGFRQSLLNQRAQHSGVSLDEEMLNIMQYQHSYQVSAKYIGTIDQLFTTLLQI